MPAPEQITLAKDGRAIAVPIDQAGSLIGQGWRVESAGARTEREAGEIKEERKPGLVCCAGWQDWSFRSKPRWGFMSMRGIWWQ